MTFLADQNLTFHRFSDGTITCDGRKAIPQVEGQVWTTNTALDYSTTNPTLMVNDSAVSTTKILPQADGDAADEPVNKRYSTYSSTCNNSTASTHQLGHNGSTTKLIQLKRDDSPNKQVSNPRKPIQRREKISRTSIKTN